MKADVIEGVPEDSSWRLDDESKNLMYYSYGVCSIRAVFMYNSFRTAYLLHRQVGEVSASSDPRVVLLWASNPRAPWQFRQS